MTPELRLDAVRASLDQFGQELLERVAASIVARPGGDVAKRQPREPLRGLL